MWKTIGIVAYLLVLSIMDMKERKVSVILLVIGGGAALLVGLWERVLLGMPAAEIVTEMFLGMLPGGFLLVLAYLTKKIGYADGLVLLTLGSIYGYVKGVAYLCISLLLLSAVSIVLLLLRRVKKDTCMPYIPFLAITHIGFMLINI